MRVRFLLLGLAVAFSVRAQFQDLATTDDGSRLYFSSPLRLKGTQQFLHPKLFTSDSQGLRLFAEREQGDSIGWTVTNFYALGSPEVAGDGSVTAFTANRPCGGGSGCLEIERFQGNLVRKGAESTYPGRITISRNGQFAVTYGSTVMFPRPETDWVDLSTGEKIRLPYDLTGAVHRRIAADGAVLLSNGGQLVLWRKSGTETLRNSSSASEAMINDAGNRIVLETASDQRKLISYDVAAARETVLAAASVPSFRFSISGDGSLVLFLQSQQASLIRADGTGLRQLTNDADGIIEGTLSGNGQIVYAVTGAGRLLRIDALSGQTSELVSRTPYITGVETGQPWAPGIAPGSLIRLTGSGLADTSATAQPPLPDTLGGVRVKLGGAAAPVYVVRPGEIWWQVSWNVTQGDAPFELESGNSSFESWPDKLSVSAVRPNFYGSPYALAVHSAWDSLVTPDNPAREGEVIHLYMSGLGAVVPPVAAGAVAPADPPARTALPLHCQFWDGGPNNTDVLFSGLAPGMVGIYQVSVRVPSGLRVKDTSLACDIGPASENSTSAIVPVQATGIP